MRVSLPTKAYEGEPSFELHALAQQCEKTTVVVASADKTTEEAFPCPVGAPRNIRSTALQLAQSANRLTCTSSQLIDAFPGATDLAYVELC
eukprot:5414702-Prymnesium_polylepis.1